MKLKVIGLLVALPALAIVGPKIPTQPDPDELGDYLELFGVTADVDLVGDILVIRESELYGKTHDLVGALSYLTTVLEFYADDYELDPTLGVHGFRYEAPGFEIEVDEIELGLLLSASSKDRVRQINEWVRMDLDEMEKPSVPIQ